MSRKWHEYSGTLRGAGLLFLALSSIGLLAFGQSRGATEPTARGGSTDYDLSWYTIDGGGVMFSTSDDGEYELSGTVGQPDAGGPMVGTVESGYELTGGFWFAQVPGDCVFDGAVNLLDHTTFIDCSSGPSTLLTGDDCPCIDLDQDQDVDLFDFGLFQLQFNGS
ncbi:MAG: hypothetical protein IH987_04615 [Planctomycetes bacterium]|nr:hypothetical protein [Planctomycetota bacterium]